MHNQMLISRCLGGKDSRYKIIEIDDGAVGVGWCEDDPGYGLVLAVGRTRDYELMRELVAEQGREPTPQDEFVHHVEFSAAQLQLLWPFIVGRFPPLQALATAITGPGEV